MVRPRLYANPGGCRGVVESVLRELSQRKLVGFLLQGCTTTEKDVSIPVASDFLLVIHKRGDRIQRAP
jgi:hypothetical protein